MHVEFMSVNSDLLITPDRDESRRNNRSLFILSHHFPLSFSCFFFALVFSSSLTSSPHFSSPLQGIVFQDAVFNQTVTITEREDGLDGETSV